MQCFASSGTDLYAGTDSGGVFLSIDGGGNWTAVNTGLTDTNVRSLATTDSGLFAGTGGGFFRSTNGGASWFVVAGITNIIFTALSAKGRHLYAGSDIGIVYRYDIQARSLSQLSGSFQGSWISAIAINDTNLFVGVDHLYRSTNYGQTWTQVDSGLTNVNGATITSSEPNLFAGTYGGGVFVSTNNGTFWTAVSPGLTNLNILALGVSGSYLFTATHSGVSVWRRPLSEMITAVHTVSPVADEYDLMQNFPNPFNPSTTIKFQIPASSHVTLKVYDVIGKEVATLVNEQLMPGAYETTVDGSGLSSGVYFCRLQAGKFVETKRLMLQK